MGVIRQVGLRVLYRVPNFIQKSEFFTLVSLIYMGFGAMVNPESIL